MTIKSISLIFIQENQPQNSAACAYALNVAEAANAHLAVCIGVPPLYVPLDAPSMEVSVWAEQENKERKIAAELASGQIEAAAAGRGISAGHEIVGDAYDPIFPRLVQFSRVSDLCIVPAPDKNAPIQHDLVVELLIASGVPVIVVPRSWAKARPFASAVVAWDGSGPAARAARDALPLLHMADSVEVVSIHGEKALPGQLEGADIATHLARHCKKVEASELPVQNGNVAQTIRQHAHIVHADLVVMGGYGHSRFREFILGGATRDMLKHIEIPTLFSH